MHYNGKAIIKAVLLSIFIFMLSDTAAAEIEISDFFSDFTSTDATVSSNQDFQGKAVFELLYEGSSVESHTIPIDLKAGKPVTKVVLWGKNPEHDYYTARVSIYNDSRLSGSRSYQVSYGTVALPSFHVVDFSPTNSGVQLLLRPFNPSAVDIEIELLDNNDIVYSKLNEDVSLVTVNEIDLAWPFLLTNNKNYVVRAKIFSHRLYAAPLINTYVAKFTATEDVEILPDDVQVDEYGASVTIRGKSQVAFDGAIVVNAKNRATHETSVYRQRVEEILVSGKEDTAGVVWRGLAPGTYDVEILAVNQENVTIDKYETVLRIPEYIPVTTTAANKTPGFTALVSFVIIFAAAWRYKRV